MFSDLGDLLTESDVEQKLIWPLLTAEYPSGFGYSAVDIFTKTSIRRLEIGKGASKRLYYPDYLVVLAGLPVLVVEAKRPGEPLEEALREARLYASEINALFPHDLNPCMRVLACNGDALWTAPVDQAEPDVELASNELTPASVLNDRLVKLCQRETLQASADEIRKRLRQEHYERPVRLLGGSAFQNEELPQNTFGATIVGDYGHVFNPRTRDDRKLIVEKAYVASLRRQRYVEPIDRLIRNAVAPTAAKIRPIEDSRSPKEILDALRGGQKLANQILLLVGSVGAGKSTFVDYLSFVALPHDLRDKTVWLRLNLNDAPLDVGLAYSWMTRAINEEFAAQFPNIDFDEISTIERIFHKQLRALKKGPLALLEPKSEAYRVRIVDELTRLQSEPLTRAQGVAEFLCGGPGRLLIVVLDNCDKRTRDEQLTMFQLAQWVRNELHCLVVLPLRDVTFELYRKSPPLDAALKQFVFRIEPPQFSEVLQARVRLALEEMARTASHSSRLSYILPNGIKVSYPAEDQAMYLASILRSLYAHDRFVRQVMTGLAGRDVRQALEIFLDFCMSGHIGEDEIYRIRFSEGQHILPLDVVARVLLRMQRRFYDGNQSYLKNVVQCAPEDALPDHLVRLALLQWFQRRLRDRGPAGVQGFHRAADMYRDLVALGHDSGRLRAEVGYLVRSGCLVAEHLRTDEIDDRDLLRITASGLIHLQLMANPEYLAACAEDTWIAEPEVCRAIAERISKGPEKQFSSITTARNALDLVDYLRRQAQQLPSSPQVFLEGSSAAVLDLLREAESAIAASERTLPRRLFVAGLSKGVKEEELRKIFEQRDIGVLDVVVPRATNGESKGYAFVGVVTGRAALDALDLNEVVTLHGQKVRIEAANSIRADNGDRQSRRSRQGRRERPSPPVSKRVYIGNLPYSFEEIDIRTLLARHELTAQDIFLLRDKRARRSRGAGFVEFRSIDEAVLAIGALNGADVAGRTLEVRPAESRDGKGDMEKGAGARRKGRSSVRKNSEDEGRPSLEQPPDEH